MTDRRLIEVEIPIKEINVESGRDKRQRHGHISTLHYWWARRPLAMCRAMVFSTLLFDSKDDGERKELMDLIVEAVPFRNSTNSNKINPLKRRLLDQFKVPPAVLDCFAGGGAIPLEALRLGCETTALDLNPVAYLIERGALEFPQQFGQPDETGRNPLAEDFIHWAEWVRERVTPQILTAYPMDERGKRPAVYFWARTMMCSACGVEIPILDSCLLANTDRRSAWIEMKPSRSLVEIVVHHEAFPNDRDLTEGTEKAGSVTCPVPDCHHTRSRSEVKDYGKKRGFGYRLFAVCEIDGSHRIYRSPTDEEIEAPLMASSLLNQLEMLPDGTTPLPDEPADEIGYRNLQFLPYGYLSWRSLFLDRQLFVLGTLCEAVRAAHAAMIDSGMAEDRARAVTTYLAFAVDRVADRNSTFCGWASDRETVRNTFPGQTIRMMWTFSEIDVLANVSGSWKGAVDWIQRVIRHCATTGGQPARVIRGNAQDLPFADASFDAVMIDPPYYFSVMYSDLSDFFYVWLKRSIGHLYPELFATQWTPKDQEIVQNRVRPSHPRYISADQFEHRLENALREVARVVKPDGIVSIVFAHTDVRAWEQLLRGLQHVGLVVSTSWPMRSEMSQRPIALIKAALDSSVVLVCRQQRGDREGFYDDVVRALESRIAERLDVFEEMQLTGADYFVSAIGPAFEVFAQYSRILKLSGEEVDVSDLMVLARQVVARYAMRRLLGEETLNALDDESLFYLTWRWAYLTSTVPADDAYKLERAFEVDLDALTGPNGFLQKSGTSFSVLGPADRKGLKLAASSSLIDVLHLACRLWDGGRRNELGELLGATGMGAEPGFWATARALGEILPDGDKERTMLLGLTGNREALSVAAAKSTANIEELRLFT